MKNSPETEQLKLPLPNEDKWVFDLIEKYEGQDY